MIDRLNESMQFFSQALALRQSRQNVLGANIANSDTPGYKARDIDFNQALQAALAQRSGAVDGSTDGKGLALARTTPGHIAGNGPSAGLGVDLKYQVPTQPSLDGNTVDMNVQRVKFMQNAIHYRSDLALLGNQIKGLKTVMQPVR